MKFTFARSNIREMECVGCENDSMGRYFSADPGGYRIESRPMGEDNE